jgi:hypothetical protein
MDIQCALALFVLRMILSEKPLHTFPDHALPPARFHELLDIGPDALWNPAAATGARVRHVPFDALLPRGPRRHAMQTMPFLVERHATALTCP